jgi:hypothetical protein
MIRIFPFAFLLGLGVFLTPAARPADEPKAADAALEVGFGEADITPKVGGKTPVYLAGFGNNRQATGVHDNLYARCIVLRHGKQRIALVSIDVVGLFFDRVEAVRKELPGFTYVLVSSTHNHEGPDTLGLWGPTKLQSGVDPDYMAHLVKQVVKSVKDADGSRKAVTARIGTARDPDLLHDGRLPIVKHDELVALEFHDAASKKRTGIVVQWNCHPETLGSKNTKVSSDFVGPTVKHLRERFKCPIVYLTGTVGGLMTSLDVPIKSKDGKELHDGTVEKTDRYGELLGQLAEKALKDPKPVRLTPLEVRARDVYLPQDNKLYTLATQLGVLKRDAYLWEGDLYKATPIKELQKGKRYCIRTEVGFLKLGEVEVAAIPGEIYPELVLSKVVDPPEAGADFPDAPIEPGIYKQMRGKYRMIIGLANDELGYIIPKRQWDVEKPYCYSRKSPQYGEGNSLGPDTAPLICKAFADLAAGRR